jgi:sulfotransferase
MATMHFISGLPRSGSTLLAALLRQNPRFEAGMSGPLSGLFGALLGEMSARNEYSVFLDDVKRQRILRGLFDNFYAHRTAEVSFDTSRAWCSWMPAIARLFPDAKVNACVRELPWIIDSIERLVQRNVFSPSSIFNYKRGRNSLYPRQRRRGPRRHGRRSVRCAQTGVLRRATGPFAASPVRDPDHGPDQDDAGYLLVS